MDKYYASAYKAGMKAYRNAIHKGEYPYLPVLDEMIPDKKSLPGKYIGILQIPAANIVGTKTVGRTTTFACNFMPIADAASEFADKWSSLCMSHLEEGIRDPVVVYEYMNRYYALEGNKRISVLKFFGAVNIQAKVYRIMPEDSDDPAVKLYLEQLEFNKKTNINFIEFSKQGSYEEFLQILEKAGFVEWDEDKVKRINTNFYYFQKAFEQCGGNQINITAADAMLSFLRIYGYDRMHEMSEDELKIALTRMWQEIIIQQEESPVDLQLQPAEPKEKKTKIISNILPSAKKTKVAFIYNDTPDNSTWVFGHEIGRLKMQKNLANKVETEKYIATEDHPVKEQLENAIFDGAKVIFATAPEMLSTCVLVAVEHPDVMIFNCNLNKPQKSVYMYYPRMYEAKFITGAIAAALSEDDRIGYICKYPIVTSIAEINAFAKGVQMINPWGKVYVEWSDKCSTREAAAKLNELGINLISVRDRLQEKRNDRLMFGLEWVENGEFTPMILPMWIWSTYYEKIMESIWNGSLRTQKETTARSLNYYWGISAGVVDMVYSDTLPPGVLYLARVLEKAICSGDCQPFYNPDGDESRPVREADLEKGIPVEELMKMDRLESNVIGTIPDYDEMREEVKNVVDAIGMTGSKGKKPL